VLLLVVFEIVFEIVVVVGVVSVKNPPNSLMERLGTLRLAKNALTLASRHEQYTPLHHRAATVARLQALRHGNHDHRRRRLQVAIDGLHAVLAASRMAQQSWTHKRNTRPLHQHTHSLSLYINLTLD
jgi:hypothetical protein